MLEPLIRKLEQFEKLPEDDRLLLQDAIREVKEIGPRQDIIQEGEKPHNVHLVLEGWAARYKLLPNGHRAIMAYLIPGDLCDVHVTLLRHMDHSVGALSRCKVAYIPREQIAAVMTERQRLSRALWWSVLVDEATLREWLVTMGHRPADRRVAHFLCEMMLRSRAVGLTEDDSFVMPITQEELGDTMGLSTVHVNRTLQDLRAQGLIASEGKRVIIHNLDQLMKFADFQSELPPSAERKILRLGVHQRAGAPPPFGSVYQLPRRSRGSRRLKRLYSNVGPDAQSTISRVTPRTSIS